MDFWVYKDERWRWVFDDAARHLAREAFVAGMDQVIDALARKHPDHGYGGIGFHMSTRKPQGRIDSLLLEHTQTLWHPALGPSNYYHCRQLGIKTWLCNNLYRYVALAPRRLHCWVDP